MSSDLSPQNEQFLRDIIQEGIFQTREQALDQAVDLLKRRLELSRHLDEGAREIEQGEGIEIRTPAELREFFETIKTERLNRYQSGQ